MNILYLCDEYPPGRHGGIGTAVQLLAREMVKNGHTVVVAGLYHWGYGGEDVFTDEGVKVFRYRMKLASERFAGNSFLTRATTRILKETSVLQWDVRRSLKMYGQAIEDLIRKFAIDIIEMPDYNDYMRFCSNYVPFPKLSVPVVVKLHGSHTYFLKEANKPVPHHIWQMEHDLLQQASMVTSVSNYTAKKTSKYLNYTHTIEILYNGLKVGPLPLVEKIALQAVFTGSLAEKKGIYQLAKAWNIVTLKEPKARLLILGKGPQGKVKALLTNEAIRTVVFKGHVDKHTLQYDLSSSALAIFPSYAETFGLAAAEAMAVGTATIFSVRTSGPEVLKDGIDGVLADPDDVNDLAQKILYLFEHDDKRNEMAINGYKRIKENFEIGIISANNVKVYYNVLLKK